MKQVAAEDRIDRGERSGMHASASSSALRPHDLRRTASTLRAAIETSIPSARIAAIMARAATELVNDSSLITRIAEGSGFSPQLIAASLQGLLAPFLDGAHLEDFARKLKTRRELVGFVMPGNIAGGGLHEVVIALLAGCSVMIKSATAEPFFFRELAKAVARADGDLAHRLAVFDWGRQQIDLTSAMRECCDRIAFFGDDATIASFDRPGDRYADNSGRGDDLSGFGDRVSCAIVMSDGGSSGEDRAPERLLARDIVLFEQRGCLSPHHIFIHDVVGSYALAFAEKLAAALDGLARELPPTTKLRLEDAAAIRRVRETARWQGLGGRQVRMWEGSNLGWTVIFDRTSAFVDSPGFRTVRVSPFADLDDLARRVEPARGRLEACAIAGSSSLNGDVRSLVEMFGASYVCDAGTMQSPPIEWPHGGGAFLRSFIN
jgi:Acyl-CoA reductase (LuxC)